jgi:hypothetical protein
VESAALEFREVSQIIAPVTKKQSELHATLNRVKDSLDVIRSRSQPPFLSVREIVLVWMLTAWMKGKPIGVVLPPEDVITRLLDKDQYLLRIFATCRHLPRCHRRRE